MDGLRPQTHQFAYGPAGAAHRTFLKVLSHAVEQHHPHRLGIIPQEHRPQGSNTHQKIFIDGAAAHHPQKGGLQYIPAYQQVGAHVGGHTGQGIAASALMNRAMPSTAGTGPMASPEQQQLPEPQLPEQQEAPSGKCSWECSVLMTCSACTPASPAWQALY